MIYLVKKELKIHMKIKYTYIQIENKCIIRDLYYFEMLTKKSQTIRRCYAFAIYIISLRKNESFQTFFECLNTAYVPKFNRK